MQMGAKMAHKMDEKSCLGHPRVETLRFRGAFWGGGFLMNFRSAKNGQQIRKLAVDCQWLHRTLAVGDPEDPYRMLCMHVIRNGDNCVGPFLENLETDCLLWEPSERFQQNQQK